MPLGLNRIIIEHLRQDKLCVTFVRLMVDFILVTTKLSVQNYFWNQTF